MGKVLLVACTNVGRAIIEAIYRAEELRDVELAGVVNLKPEVAISKANYDSYVDLRQKYGFPLYYCGNINEEDCVSFMSSLEPDILIQSGWSQKFSEKVLEIPRHACIGEHPAPLPKGRGAACINWAIITGESEWGDTFFKMESTYDTGLIYSQEFFRIEEYDDVKTVYDKVANASASAVKKNLGNWVQGILEGRAQDDTCATHYPRRRPSDGRLDLAESARDVYNQIRGQARPYPGAYIERSLDGIVKRMFIWKASLVENSENEGVAVECGDGNKLYLLRVQLEGEPEIWASENPSIVKWFVS